ncbi:glyceraldehyde 3-phosphate dehydrogenase NAD-binding domain-containing protein, partial [Pedobacter sp.]|uniref:glyceraldehyde 3-phosphate dehydrogenase NAD-binding domain-containing protein n=1 Tax=Pedobacter sp. TaxID=1411316 RepID=UPI002D0D617D
MKIAINGFGRIGRIFLRTAIERGVDIAAINDLADPATLAHLFKYDTVHRGFKGEVSFDKEALIINGKRILVYSNPNAKELPWAELGIDLVLESTGKHTSRAAASLHLEAGAKQV